MKELIIPLDNEVDIKFFKDWINKEVDIKLKKDYVKDLIIFKVNECGTLKNCWPILNLNEDEVQIVYDFYTDRKILEY